MTPIKQYRPDVAEIMAACTRPAWAHARRCPSTEIGSGHRVPSLSKKLFAIGGCWQREKEEVSLDISKPLQSRPHAWE